MTNTKIIQAILEKVSSIDNRVNTINSKVNSIDTRVDSIDSKVAEIDTRVDSIDNRFDSMEERMSRGFDEVKVMISENGERIDKLGLQLAELEDDAPTREEQEELEHRLEEL